MLAVARQPKSGGPGVTNAVGDVRDLGFLRAALTGCDAVISALGQGPSRKETTLYSEGVKNLISAMHENSVTRIAVISAAPVGSRDEHPAIQRMILMPLLDIPFGSIYRDMARMEAVLSRSAVDWTSLRPPRLISREGRGEYRLSVGRPLSKGSSLRYDDLASALIEGLDDPALSKAIAYVAD